MREPLDPVDSVGKLAELGAWGINLHDDDLVPLGTPAAERDRIVSRFKAALDDQRARRADGHHEPVQPSGVQGRRVHVKRPRRAARGDRKTMRAIDLGAELGAEVYVCWGGREGTEAGVASARRTRSSASARRSTSCATTASDQGYGLRFALEPKPNEPRGDIYLPTVGHALHFITTLDHPEMVGVNPEVAHETMAGLSFTHAVAQAMEAGQAVPYRPQRPAHRALRPGLPLRRRGSQGAFLLVRALEAAGYAGPRAFDAHAYRNESADGVWDFARGCMRTYLALAERARHFDALPEVQEALEAASAPELARASVEATRPRR